MLTESYFNYLCVWIGAVRPWPDTAYCHQYFKVAAVHQFSKGLRYIEVSRRLQPKMKGANWLKLICHQGRSLVNIFSLWNIWYESVVLFLIWLHSLECQILKKTNITTSGLERQYLCWVVSCHECGGWQLGQCTASMKQLIRSCLTHRADCSVATQKLQDFVF